MLRIIYLVIGTAWLLTMTLVYAQGDGPQVWVALSEDGGPYAESAAVLRAELESRTRLVTGKWPDLFAGGTPPPNLVVTVGQAAFEGVLGELDRRGPGWGRIPVLATLLPRTGYEKRLEDYRREKRQISAVVLDQPPERQLALIARALPDRNAVGVMAGIQTLGMVDALAGAAARRGLKLNTIKATDALYPALRWLLETSNVLLAVPDPVIYHGGSLQNILLTAYRARVPVVAFSPAYVKAGAVLAVYSTPEQVARSAAELVRGWLAGRSLPSLQSPREFSVATNPKVAASLGIRLDDATDIAAALRRDEER